MASRVELNRTLLHRQALDERLPLGVEAAVEHLAGLNGQFASGPYIGLWNRLTDFDRDGLTTALRERRIVRATLMRGTVHLLTANDYCLFRPPLTPMLERGFRGYFPESWRSIDIDVLAARARELLAEQPMSRPELDRALVPLAPEVRDGSRAFAVRARLPLVQVPPAGEWGSAREVRYALAEDWLGRPMGDPAEGREHLVTRYLGAFGPATAADVAAWSGLSGMRADLERMRAALRRFDDGGQTFYDLADAKPVDLGAAPPVRFLPDYDNVLFGHKDRSRVLPDAHRRTVVPTGRRMPGTVLVDGFVAGTWRHDEDAAGGAGAVVVEPLEPIARRHRAALVEEGGRLARFLTGVDDADVRLG
jgi:winged helix DNA-binding protein